VSSKLLAQEGEKLLAVDPSQFVAERDRLVRQLRSVDRGGEADIVAGLRKPTVVVFAVNRAARDRPKAAAGAAEAARKLRDSQVAGKPESFRKAGAELETALDLLAEVAVAHVAPRGKPPSDALRRRVRDLLRTAVADDDARDALVRGALSDELETVGFSSYVGMAPALAERPRRESAGSQSEERARKQHERKQALRRELDQAERQLELASKAVREAKGKRKGRRASRDLDTGEARPHRLNIPPRMFSASPHVQPTPR